MPVRACPELRSQPRRGTSPYRDCLNRRYIRVGSRLHRAFWFGRLTAGAEGWVSVVMLAVLPAVTDCSPIVSIVDAVPAMGRVVTLHLPCRADRRRAALRLLPQPDD